MSRGKLAATIAVCAALVAMVFWLLAGSSEVAQPAQSRASGGSNRPTGLNMMSPFGSSASAARAGAPLSSQGASERQAAIAQARARYERAVHTYTSYRDATRYPHDSRPLSEHADQARPFDPIVEEKALRDEKGVPVGNLTLKTAQSRVFLSGRETVSFSLQAFNERGEPVPFTVTKAAAQSLPNGTTLQTIRSTALNFAGDAARSGPQPVSVIFTPAAQGFDNFEGAIRALAWVRVGDKQGVASFEVIYQPEVPAAWGSIGDAVADGSLAFKVQIQVRKAGRYVVSGRVDDAEGRGVALLNFNEELAAGNQVATLKLFGALIHDAKPKFPLRLRDVDGFLLYENRFPDRSMLPRLYGNVHTSGVYSLSQFSNAEWNGEERIRHLREFENDVNRTKQELERLERGGP